MAKIRGLPGHARPECVPAFGEGGIIVKGEDVEIGASASRQGVIQKRGVEAPALGGEVIVGDAAEKDEGIGIGLFDRFVGQSQAVRIKLAALAKTMALRAEEAVGFVVDSPTGARCMGRRCSGRRHRARSAGTCPRPRAAAGRKSCPPPIRRCRPAGKSVPGQPAGPRAVWHRPFANDRSAAWSALVRYAAS